MQERERIDKRFRLSPQQKRVWHLAQSGEAFHAQCAIRIEWSLDSEALLKALRKRLERRKILRATIDWIPGGEMPVQLILGDAPLPCWRGDLSDQTLKEQEAAVHLVLSDNIKQKLKSYDAGLPVNMPYVDEDTYYRNFEVEFKNYWTNGSYHCILAGLGREPKHTLPMLAYRSDRQVKA